MVPVKQGDSQGESQPSAVPEPIKPQPMNLIVDPHDVFKRVLQRGQNSMTEEKVEASRPVASAARCNPMGQTFGGGFLEGLMLGGNFDASESALLREASGQAPINQGFKSQLARANKARKAQMEEEPEDDLEEVDDDTEVVLEELDEEEDGHKEHASGKGKNPKIAGKPLKEPKPKSKAAAKPKCKASAKKRAKEPELNEKETVETTENPKKSKCPKLDAEKPHPDGPVPEGFDSTVTRAINRKRYTSRAWHKAFDKAKAAKESPDECYAKAKAASQKASETFVELWPRARNPVDVD